MFFALPDGQGLMYYVTGTAEAPKPNGKVTRDVPCKTSFVETLPVQNWLSRSQRSVSIITDFYRHTSVKCKNPDSPKYLCLLNIRWTGPQNIVAFFARELA